MFILLLHYILTFPLTYLSNTLTETLDSLLYTQMSEVAEPVGEIMPAKSEDKLEIEKEEMESKVELSYANTEVWRVH